MIKRLPIFTVVLVCLAAILAQAFLAAHWMGLRENVMVLSGTWPAQGDWSSAGGVVYVLLYLGYVVVAPVLVLWAFLYELGHLVLVRAKTQQPSRWVTDGSRSSQSQPSAG